MQNIAREASVPRSSVEGYFSILIDTLLAHLLPPYRPHLKVREAAHPKFYWTDSGIARAAAGWLRDPVDRTWLGASLESLIFHELRTYNQAHRKYRPITYYRTAAGAEIDFVIETSRRTRETPASVVCLEVKKATRWNRKWERCMRDVHALSGLRVEKMIGVYTGKQIYHFDGVDVWPADEFLRRLHAGEVF